jgi:CRP-like cAMP-binding protein
MGGREREFTKSFEPGEIIVREGDDGREMFVVQSGRVEITKQIDDRSVKLGEMGRGDFFGEMSLLESQPRAATATAADATRVLVISPGSLLLRIRRDPTFAFELLQGLSGRIRALHRRLEDASREGPISAEEARNIVRGPELEAP